MFPSSSLTQMRNLGRQLTPTAQSWHREACVGSDVLPHRAGLRSAQTPFCARRVSLCPTLAHEAVDTAAVTGGLSSAPGRGRPLHDGRPAAGVLQRAHADQLLQQVVAQRQRLLRSKQFDQNMIVSQHQASVDWNQLL